MISLRKLWAIVAFLCLFASFQNCAPKVSTKTNAVTTNEQSSEDPAATPTPAPAVFSKVNQLSSPMNERTYGVIQTSDGGFLTGGYQRPANQTDGAFNDGVVTKWNELGQHVWTAILKGPIASDQNDQVFDIVEVADGYIAAGLVKSFLTGYSAATYPADEIMPRPPLTDDLDCKIVP